MNDMKIPCHPDLSFQLEKKTTFYRTSLFVFKTRSIGQFTNIPLNHLKYYHAGYHRGHSMDCYLTTMSLLCVERELATVALPLRMVHRRIAKFHRAEHETEKPDFLRMKSRPTMTVAQLMLIWFLGVCSSLH
jgi:hypothetical protein